jgi:hypothetical protein
MIRPEVLAFLLRAREVIVAAFVVGFGAWLIALGGYLLTPLGLAVGALGLSFGVLAWRRLRFAQGSDSPGVVEVDEGQVGYMGPTAGGFVSLPELVEIRLLTLRGRRVWRLKQADGQALLIPVDAAGAERLFDAFASLPGMDSGALVQALGQAAATDSTLPALQTPEIKVIWRRQGAGVVLRP